MVRDFAAKLRITAAALGCASQKDLCARFREVNPATTFELERSYKWMQARALPRSARLYEDWAMLLDTGRPLAWLRSCTVDEFLKLMSDRFKVDREVLVARAELGIVPGPEVAEPEQRHALSGRHLAGVYACYSHAWSPYFRGMVSRSRLKLEAATGASPALLANYAARVVGLGRVEVRGRATITERSVHVDLVQPVKFRLALSLFLPGPMASVLAGVISGASWMNSPAQPGAGRIVMIRVPGVQAAALDASNGYLAPEMPLSRDLIKLGLPLADPTELDALLQAFLAADQRNSYIKVGAEEYSRLALAVDRLFIENDGAVAVRPLPARAPRSSRDRMRLVQG